MSVLVDSFLMTGGAVSAPLDDVAPHTLVLRAYPYGQLGSVDLFNALTLVCARAFECPSLMLCAHRRGSIIHKF
jgi:hypothetical protein